MIKSLKNVIKAFFSLLAFLTTIPIPRSLLINAPMFSHLYLLPIIGFIRGLVTVVPLLIAILTKFDILSLAAFAIIVLHYIAQGFIHVDGFIDFSEAILAHRFGVNGYKVVKDKYRGSYAIAVFGVYIIGLFSALQMLIEKLDILALVGLVLLIEILSTNVMLTLSYIGKKPSEGLGKIFGESVKPCDVVISLTVSAVLAIVITFITGLSSWCTLSVALSAILSIYISSILAHKVLGFVNGDVLGFSSELFYLISLIICGVATWS